MTSRLFKRTCSVSVGSTLVEGLRTTFSLKKTLKKEPNTLDLKIYNLSETTRSKMQEKGSAVILSAGYEENKGVIFSGDSRTIDHVREGADWVTKVRCGDGERAYLYSRVNESFKPGTAIRDVIMSVGDKLISNKGNLEKTLNAATFKNNLQEYANGVSLVGRASAVFDNLMGLANLEWSLQNGAIQARPAGSPAEFTATLLNENTGLIGSPEHGTPEDKGTGKRGRIRLRSLLQPQLVCGGVVVVESFGVNGKFMIVELEHVGDTDSGDWYSIMEVEAYE